MLGNELIYVSADQHDLIGKLDRIAANDAEVMILGPSGVGKELYAEYIHRKSRRHGQPFVVVNCANFSIETLENELFGHARGSFTGASASSTGIVAAADGGTLFLDEINSLSLGCQAKLLRFVQLKEYRRLGESFTRKVQLRLISATNQDLRALVDAGQFREDLFYRLHVLPVTISPLRDRPDDAGALLDWFSRRYAREYGLPPVRLGAAALAAFEAHDWPGNVRELENAVRYLTCLDLGREVEPADLPFRPRPRPVPVSTGPALPLPALPQPTLPQPALAQPAVPTLAMADDAPPPSPDVSDLPLREAKTLMVGTFERAYVETALHRNQGNVAQAARSSGKHRRAFFELMRRYGIDPGMFRHGAAADDGAPGEQ